MRPDAAALAPVMADGGPVPGSELEARLAGVRRILAEQDLEAAVVTGAEDIYYLTGLTFFGHFTFSALLVPRAREVVLVMRAVENATVAAQLPTVRFAGYGDERPAGAVLAGLLGDLVGGRAQVGYDSWSLSMPIQVWRTLDEALPGTQWVDVGAALTRLRVVKTPWELGCLRQAAALSDQAMTAAADAVRAGATQADVAAAAYHTMISNGGEPPGFPPFIRELDRLTRYHETWSSTPPSGSRGVFIELSASVRRYHAPLSRQASRTAWPADVQRGLEIAAVGLEAAREAMRPGVTAGEVHDAWRATVCAELGDPRYNAAHCGYAVGIGLPPSWVGGSHNLTLRPGSALELRQDMTFHVMSWLVGASRAGCCLSDTIAVTATGGARLTRLGRDAGRPRSE